MLRNRKGQFVMDFYLVGMITPHSSEYIRNWQTTNRVFGGWLGSAPSSTDPNSCWRECSKINYNTTGYKTIDEALQDGWTIKQVLGDIAQSGITYDDCTCQGKKYLMIKQ